MFILVVRYVEGSRKRKCLTCAPSSGCVMNYCTCAAVKLVTLVYYFWQKYSAVVFNVKLKYIEAKCISIYNCWLLLFSNKYPNILHGAEPLPGLLEGSCLTDWLGWYLLHFPFLFKACAQVDNIWSKLNFLLVCVIFSYNFISSCMWMFKSNLLLLLVFLCLWAISSLLHFYFLSWLWGHLCQLLLHSNCTVAVFFIYFVQLHLNEFYSCFLLPNVHNVLMLFFTFVKHNWLFEICCINKVALPILYIICSLLISHLI